MWEGGELPVSGAERPKRAAHGGWSSFPIDDHRLQSPYLGGEPGAWVAAAAAVGAGRFFVAPIIWSIAGPIRIVPGPPASFTPALASSDAVARSNRRSGSTDVDAGPSLPPLPLPPPSLPLPMSPASIEVRALVLPPPPPPPP